MSPIQYRTQPVGPMEVFYREAGPADAPVLLLLHGFPTSSHMFRDLIPALSDRYHVIAPDLPGFGLTKSPAGFEYSFDTLATTIGQFVDALGLTQYAIYIFDYGAPTGLRLAMAHPERVTAIITQNGNAYTEGLSTAWEPFQAYWRDPTDANRAQCRAALTDDAIRDQYEHGAPAGRVSPDGYTLDQHYMHRPGAIDIQLDLILSYRTNVALYPAFQAYFRAHQPRLLAIWAKTTPSSSHPAPKPTAATCRKRKSTSSTPAISPWKPTTPRSPRISSASSASGGGRSRTMTVPSRVPAPKSVCARGGPRKLLT